jgi:hypothetical protein
MAVVVDVLRAGSTIVRPSRAARESLVSARPRVSGTPRGVATVVSDRKDTGPAGTTCWDIT